MRVADDVVIGYARVVFRQRLTHLRRGVSFLFCSLYPQRMSALHPDQNLLPTVGGHQAEPVIVAGARQQKELRVRMQVGEPFGVPYGDEGIFLATHYYDLTCVVLERVDRIERVMQYPSHWKQR
jgi:hypothetical protein